MHQKPLLRGRNPRRLSLKKIDLLTKARALWQQLLSLLSPFLSSREKEGGGRGRRAPSLEFRKSKIQKSRSKNWRAFCPSTHPLSGKETVLHCILLRHSFAMKRNINLKSNLFRIGAPGHSRAISVTLGSNISRTL